MGCDGKGSAYPGPMGSVVSPALFGQLEFGHLARASSLCGACKEACPVDIDLPKLLLRIRAGIGVTIIEMLPNPMLQRYYQSVWVYLPQQPRHQGVLHLHNGWLDYLVQWHPYSQRVIRGYIYQHSVDGVSPRISPAQLQNRSVKDILQGPELYRVSMKNYQHKVAHQLRATRR